MNPLLQPSPLKHAAVPFAQIQPEHFMPALTEAIRQGRENLARIKAAPASFDNTMRGLESCSEELEFVYMIFNNLLSAHSNASLQALSLELGPKVAAFANDILLDPEIFAQVKTVYNQRLSLALSHEQIRLVEKIYRDFARSGAGLNETQKQRLREIDQRLSQLSPMFRENVLKASNAFELWVEDEKDLIGLPESHKVAAQEAAREKGRDGFWLFNLQYPSYAPFMKFSGMRYLREKMYRAFSARGFGGEFDNQSIIREEVTLLREKAQMMGCRSYAEYALQLRMAETPERVMSFLQKLLTAAKPSAERELNELEQLALKDGITPLQPWDFSYYSEKLKEQKYAFDEEALRPYFKLENVLKGVFEHAHKLFGLNFIESREYPTYHDDVRVFEVYKDSPEREFIGLFYGDFFPRASKSQGAWMTNYYEQGVFRGKRVRPHVAIVCNFTKPSAEQPALLSFDEVSTLFHEFGHALHGLLSQVEFRSLSGTNVFLDFVELPSQIFENWAEEAESLSLYAFHYQTGDLIPPQLIEGLKRAQKFQVGYATLRQLSFAMLDMAYFTDPPDSQESIVDYERRKTESTRLLPAVDGTCISTAFSHIFGGGYSSGYYGYKWAEALDADAFELFREKGVFNREVAQRFEEFILSKGASDHPMLLYERFRGRKPDPDALLRRDGLTV